jgi:hypothetical protein
MPPAEDSYLIVVAGAMNPAIHHPSWYEIAGILSNDEVAKANESGVVVVSPQVASFNVGQISITCIPARWQIQATSEGDFQKTAEVAERTFKVLYHTPISAFGINFMHHRVVRFENVAAELAKAVRRLDLGFIHETDQPEAGKLIYETSTEDKFVTVRIEPSVSGPNQIYLAIHIERRFKPADPTKFVQFDLKPKDWAAEDLDYAKKQLASVLKSIETGSQGATHNGV